VLYLTRSRERVEVVAGRVAVTTVVGQGADEQACHIAHAVRKRPLVLRKLDMLRTLTNRLQLQCQASWR